MDAKQFFKNKSLCLIPWTGFMLDTDGGVRNCVLSQNSIGHINKNNIKDILTSDKNTYIKKQMLDNKMPSTCEGCYKLERNKNKLNIVSSRLYYLKELKKIDLNITDNEKNFNLHQVDLRWTNQCNQACVYCGPEFSSIWAKELKQTIKMDVKQKNKVKKYVFENIKQLKNVYLAGGEPLLMNENKEFLQLLLEQNKDVTVRVNTNLSSVGTSVYKLLTKFKNVHWTVSVESMDNEYNYIRYGGSWLVFLQNLKTIQKLNHKISFNMLHFILNYLSIFNCIDFLKEQGFTNNSFIVGPLTTPEHLNILNLPDEELNKVKEILKARIDKQPGFLLQDSYENLLKYLSTPFKKNIENFKTQSKIIDKRRSLNSKETFSELYKIIY